MMIEAEIKRKRIKVDMIFVLKARSLHC
jgi:hypothetical protein